MVVVVVVVIPVGGISSLPRRKAVFSQSRCSLPHFHLPRPSPFLCSYGKRKGGCFFLCIRERGLKKCNKTVNYSDLTRETGCPYIKLNLRTYWVRKLRCRHINGISLPLKIKKWGIWACQLKWLGSASMSIVHWIFFLFYFILFYLFFALQTYIKCLQY